MGDRGTSAQDTVFTVQEDEGGVRLDAYLAGKVPGLSRRRAGLIAQEGRVRVGKAVAKKGHLVQRGDRVEIAGALPSSREAVLPDRDIAERLRFVYTSPQIVVVDKPAGIPSVPQRPGEMGTLAGGVAAAFPECAELGRRFGDGGLVNRLDTATSGLVLVARSLPVHRRLVELQRAGRIAKGYLALVENSGAPLPAVIDTPLAPVGPRGRAMRPSPEGLEARTEIRAVRDIGRWRLLEVEIHKGVRHQIRAHLAGAGHPIAGDPVYGGAFPEGLTRLFLHAFRIAIPEYEEIPAVTVESALPLQLSRIVE